MAKKAVEQGRVSKRSVKVRKNVTFKRPKTLRLPKAPRFPRRAVYGKGTKMDKFAVVKSPLTTESAMKMIEETNTLTFVVDMRATKNKIKAAVKGLYKVDVEKINTLIRPDGKKKAFCKLPAGVEALDVANRIGIL